MKKRRRSIEGEFCLPEAMIQHIQSFLPVKAAARTTTVSQSWHTAWSTRPNLEFDQRDFTPNNTDAFWEFMDKTLQRYQQFNLKIESFRLYLTAGKHMFREKSINMVKESIAKAMKLGTVDFNFGSEWTRITLPSEVLESDTLIRLSLYRCKIDLGEDRRICCRGLKSLSFKSVDMESDTTLCDIVSSCPLIENFIVLPWRVPEPSSVHAGPFNLYHLYNIKCLVLYSVRLNSSFFGDLSSKFPFLKDLTLDDCRGCDGIELCSTSLESISLAYYDYGDILLRAKCEVPNIREFKYMGRNLPLLSFKTASRKWESDINISCNYGSAKWFLELNQFLDCLSLSRISLSLSMVRFVERDVDFQGVRKIAVENLNIGGMHCVDSHIVKCLFQSCRPKFITQYSYPSIGRNMFLKILYKTLMQGARRVRSSVFVAQDLEEVNVELFEESDEEWRPLPWSTLFKNSSQLKKKKKLRLQLKWRPELSDPGDADMR